MDGLSLQTKENVVTKNKFSKFLSTFDSNEAGVINQVADEYELEGDSRKLLFAIRRAENGGVGREFGVLNPEAMRFKDDPAKSFVTQARWAAGTIKKRYKGNLKEFRDRWAPLGAENDPTGLNENWVKKH